MTRQTLDISITKRLRRALQRADGATDRHLHHALAARRQIDADRALLGVAASPLDPAAGAHAFQQLAHRRARTGAVARTPDAWQSRCVDARCAQSAHRQLLGSRLACADRPARAATRDAGAVAAPRRRYRFGLVTPVRRA
jgi:hypothetical protein